VLAIRGDDELLGAAVVRTDVTRFHLLDQLKSDMVSTVSHELKTPLTSLQMAIHLLLEEVVGPLVPKQVELLLAARQDADRLLATINDLLDLTRIEQGRVRLDRHPTPAADLIGEAVERFEARARDAGVTVESAVAPGPPTVLADRERVGHVLDNLVHNALAHTDAGGSVRLWAGLQGASVRLAVTDTGQGIPAEHLPYLFEMFYRVPGSRSPRGAGLGLAITREIVVAHGGQLGVESRPGRGTTFTFTLPIAPDAMVGLSSRSPKAPALLRKAARLADRLNAPWYAVYIQAPSEDLTRVDAVTQRILGKNLELAQQLGVIPMTFRGPDVVRAILAFAREYGIRVIVLGKSRLPAYRRLLGGSILERILREAEGIDLVIVDV
jgi:K+-sensing histidine kinase KdpD